VKTCSVLIADSNTRLSQLVGQLLGDEPGFRVLGVQHTAADALRAADERRPDVVLLSDRLEGRPVAPVCELLRQVVPAAALAMWSHDPAGHGEGQAAVDAVVERGMTFRELVRELRDLVDRSDGATPRAQRGQVATPTPPGLRDATGRTLLDDPEASGSLLLNCDSCTVQVRLATDDVAPAVEAARAFFAEHASCDTAIDLTEQLRQPTVR
jgi:DNA-binding response OmpR family regulator